MLPALAKMCYICKKALSMNKFWLTVVFALLSVMPGASQSIKDYFYQHRYTVVDEYGRRWPTDKAINIIPLNGGDAQYEHRLSSDGMELKSAYLFDDGNALISNWKTISSVTHKLDYQDNAIYSISQSTYNPLTDSRTSKDRITLIALPGASWVESQNGDKYECSTEWAYLSTGSAAYKAIKVTKSLIGSNTSLDGIVQNSYWAEGLGLVLVEHITSGVAKKDSYRINFDNISFISDDQYIKQEAWYKFVDEQDQFEYRLRQLREDSYFFMESEFAKAILEDAGNHGLSFECPDAIDRQNVSTAEWPTVSSEHKSTVFMDKDGVDRDRSYGDPFRWFIKAYQRLEQRSNYSYPYIIESVSGNKYYPNLKDEYSLKEISTSYILTFKKGRNGYDLKKGNEAVWEACKEKLQPFIADIKKDMDNPLDMLFAPNQLRIIKSTCGAHTAYYVAKKPWIDYGVVHCNLELLLVK